MAEEKNQDAEWLGHWNGWWEVEARQNWDKFLDFMGLPAVAQEAATMQVDRHRYRMTKDSFSLLHIIPAQKFEVDFDALVDWEWHDCPYPKPTAKLADDESANDTVKTQWRNRWVTFPRVFETEIQNFIQGKNFRFSRELVSATEMKFKVSVLEGEGEGSSVLVGPCLATFRKDGVVEGIVKMAAKKGVSFYAKVARGFLQGSPMKDGAWRRALPRIQLHALGNAINDAGGVAAALESQGVGIIARGRTGQVEIGGKQVPEISIHMIRKDAGILPFVSVVPFGVLGTGMQMTGEMATVAEEPGPDTAFVDPAGLPFIKSSPGGAGGAAGALYAWLGITNDPTFPEPVVSAINKALDAKFHAYGAKKCVHVVGPNFSGSGVNRQEAVDQLAKAYQALLVEFVASGLPNLRMLPVSGGIFAGQFISEFHTITAEALQLGFAAMTPQQQQQVLLASRLDMCIFMEKDVKIYSEAFAIRRAA